MSVSGASPMLPLVDVAAFQPKGPLLPTVSIGIASGPVLCCCRRRAKTRTITAVRMKAAPPPTVPAMTATPPLPLLLASPSMLLALSAPMRPAPYCWQNASSSSEPSAQSMPPLQITSRATHNGGDVAQRNGSSGGHVRRPPFDDATAALRQPVGSVAAVRRPAAHRHLPRQGRVRP